MTEELRYIVEVFFEDPIWIARVKKSGDERCIIGPECPGPESAIKGAIKCANIKDLL